MNRTQRILLAVSLSLILGLLVSCGQGSSAIGWVESSVPGHWQARYETFDGTKIETVPLDTGDALVLDYEAEVSAGNLSMEVQDPDGKVLWGISLCQNAGDEAKICLERGGRYAIVVRGDDTGGSFDLSWKTE